VKRSLFFFVLGLVLPGILLLMLAWSGSLPVNATSSPSRLEAAIASRALDARLDKESKGLTNPMKPDEPTLREGMKIYRDDCEGCHGSPGRLSKWGTNDLYPRAPQFADEAADMEPGVMFTLVKYGVRYTGMGAWQGLASDEEIWKVVTFLHAMGSLPPGVAAEWKASRPDSTGAETH
jgi:mono/diheme cytochrome c family protein